MKTNDALKIDVGGAIFTSTYETFSKSPMLATFLDNRESEDDIIFIDKTPKIFKYVLEILREDLAFEEVPTKYKRLVFRMLDYFLLRNFIGDPKYFKIEPKESHNKKFTRSIHRSDQTFVLQKGQRVNNLVIIFKKVGVDIEFSINIENATHLSVKEKVKTLEQKYAIGIEVLEKLHLDLHLISYCYDLEEIYLEVD